MKYKVLLSPIQVTADTQATAGEIIDLAEADGTQLTRWGIVEPVIEEPAPPEPPAKTTTAKATTTAKTTTTDSTDTTTAK